MYYDPFAPEVQADPHPYYRWLRDEAPAYHNAERDLWALSRYADVQRASRDWQTFSVAEGSEPDSAGKVLGFNGFLDLDPPRHDELRRIVRDAFAPAAVARLEDDIAQRADALIDGLVESAASSGQADLALGYAWALPLGVVSHLVGVPDADVSRLIRLIFQCYEPSPFEPTDDVLAAAAELRAYFAAALDDRASAPADDLLTRLAAARAGGEVKLDEALDTALLLFTAGYLTTAGLIGSAVELLAAHPDERRVLAAQPGRMAVAVEEFLRFEPPITGLCRTTTADVELHGRVIPKGSRVMLLYAAANRDERRFPDPDRLRLDRPDNHHLAFGEGVHKCLGAGLARLEGRVALTRLLARVPDYTVSGSVQRVSSPVSRDIVSLPVELNAGS